MILCTTCFTCTHTHERARAHTYTHSVLVSDAWFDNSTFCQRN